MIKSAHFINKSNGRQYVLVCHKDLFNQIVVCRYYGCHRDVLAQTTEADALHFFDDEVARRKKRGYTQWK